MLHSKVVLAGAAVSPKANKCEQQQQFWSTAALRLSARPNMDNRSLHLNFEANCLIYEPAVTQELEEVFLNDLSSAVRLDRHVFLPASAQSTPWTAQPGCFRRFL